jgi:putative ABC transport system ATP-binding protein
MMERRLFRYIWNHTRPQQVWILFIVLISMPTYFLSLDLPKAIVNGPILGEGFIDENATARFLEIALTLPTWLLPSGTLTLFEGFDLNRFQTLMALSFYFLVLVVINGLFKLYINTYKGRLGERMLRRLRYELIDRVLRFPPAQFRRVKSPEIATMVKDEVEPLGGFIGDAFVQPALLGGQAITALIFIIVQNFWLGAMAAAIVTVQAVFIPRLRRKLIILGKERQLTARELAGRVGEIIDGIQSVRVNDTSNYERADIAHRLGRIFKIRYDLYQWKFFVKFLNNFLAQVTPFLFYSIGGWLALRGQLDVGQLVAVIAAYKDLPGPIKELIDWDQQRLDVQVKYTQVIDQFAVESMVDPQIQALSASSPPPLAAPIHIANLSITDDSGARLLEKASLQIAKGEKLAVVGLAGSGGEAVAEALARLLAPDSGRASIDGQDLFQLPDSIVGRRMGYASSDTPLFHGTIRDNLLYALKHAPLSPHAYPADEMKHREWEEHEAKRAGNPLLDIRADWIDYASAGANGPEDLFPVIMQVLTSAALLHDIYEFGLRATVDPERHPEIVERIGETRAGLRARLEAEGLADLVEPFDPAHYNTEAGVAENILFGAPGSPIFKGKLLAGNDYFRTVLRRHGLDESLYAMGLEIAKNVVELFRDLPPDHPFFEQLTFMTAEEIPAYQMLIQKLQDKPFSGVADPDRQKIISLSFPYIEPRYRFGLLDDALMAKIVEARADFRKTLPEDLKDSIDFYDAQHFNRAANLIDNVLFGRISARRAEGAERIREMVLDALQDLGLGDEVLAVGLDFNVGSGGKRLSAAQRQKLHMARVLIKRPDILIFNRPLGALDLRAQEEIAKTVLGEVRQAGRDVTIVWALSHPVMARMFDRIAVFEHGTVVETGSYDELFGQKGLFAKLMA